MAQLLDTTITKTLKIITDPIQGSYSDHQNNRNHYREL